MKMTLLALVCCPLAFGQQTTAFIEAQRETLLKEVQDIPKIGAPGPIALWGELTFPVLSGLDRNNTEAVLMAAAACGKGRVVLFGQNGYVAGNRNDGSAALLMNAVRWAGSKDKPEVGLLGMRERPQALDGHVILQDIKTITQESLRTLDVLLVNAQGVDSPADADVIMEFVKGGGGLVAGMTGWAYELTSGGKRLATDHGLNQALAAEAGMAFTDESAFSEVNQFTARTSLPKFLNAAEGLSMLRSSGKGGASLDSAAGESIAHAIQLAIAVQPPGRQELLKGVMAALEEAGGDARQPRAAEPLTTERHTKERLRLGIESRVLASAADPSVKAHPAHEHFPGKVSPNARRGGGLVRVEPAVPGWTSTGWYAAAGETIVIKVPPSALSEQLSVRVGCHSDKLYHLDKWKRAPEVCVRVPITKPVTEVTSAFGGLIYIECREKAADRETLPPFEVSIDNAVAAPLFVLGRDDDAKWNRELKRREAPWAEFVCDKVILSCPAEVAREVSNPTMLMEFWKAVVEAQDDLCNQATERKRPERIVADVQISAGYMHSGYPIMIPTSAAAEMVTFNRLQFPGWGFYHELGHNHQRPWFTFDGTVEVTCNVIGMYCYETVLKKDWLIGHTEVSKEAREKHVQTIKNAANRWQVWKSSPFVALTTYIQLVQAFGWESWRKYLHSFADESFGPKPADDDEARDQFLIRYSRIVNRNLGPFFEFWGIPVSSEAKAKVAALESWMPDGI